VTDGQIDGFIIASTRIVIAQLLSLIRAAFLTFWDNGPRPQNVQNSSSPPPFSNNAHSSELSNVVHGRWFSGSTQPDSHPVLCNLDRWLATANDTSYNPFAHYCQLVITFSHVTSWLFIFRCVCLVQCSYCVAYLWLQIGNVVRHRPRASENCSILALLTYLITCFILYFLQSIRVIGSDVKSSRPKWPRGQNFGLGLGLKHLASARPRSRCHIMLSGIFRAKIVWNSGILLTFPAIILNRRCCYLLIIMWYFFHNYIWPRSWPQPPEIGLGLEVLASFNITG